MPSEHETNSTANLYGRRRALTLSLAALEREIEARRATIGEIEAELAKRLLFVSAYRPRHPVPTITGRKLGRTVLACLRDAERALTTPELTARVVAAHGAVLTEREAILEAQRRVRECVQRLRRKGMTVSVAGGARLAWRLTKE